MRSTLSLSAFTCASTAASDWLGSACPTPPGRTVSAAAAAAVSARARANERGLRGVANWRLSCSVDRLPGELTGSGGKRALRRLLSERVLRPLTTIHPRERGSPAPRGTWGNSRVNSAVAQAPYPVGGE